MNKPKSMEPRKLPTWREMNMDTSPAAEAVLFQLYREAPVWKKWRTVCSLNETVRALAMSGLRRRYPKATSTQLRRLLADIMLGPELAERVYGPHPTPLESIE
ncbi:MAG: hypothetical protein U0350_04565 [Caldilineaceae bacterium]